MNKRIIAIVAICVALLPSACNKNFLNQTDTFAATEQATFQKPQQVIDLVNSIYNTFQSADLLKKSIWYYANFLTHDWYNNGNDIVWKKDRITVAEDGRQWWVWGDPAWSVAPVNGVECAPGSRLPMPVMARATAGAQRCDSDNTMTGPSSLRSSAGSAPR